MFATLSVLCIPVRTILRMLGMLVMCFIAALCRFILTPMSSWIWKTEFCPINWKCNMEENSTWMCNSDYTSRNNNAVETHDDNWERKTNASYNLSVEGDGRERERERKRWKKEFKQIPCLCAIRIISPKSIKQRNSFQ